MGELGKKAIHMETAMLVSTNFYICISIWIKKVPNSPDSPGSTTNLASPEYRDVSALTTSTLMVAMIDPYWSFLAFSKASSIDPTM